jgi:hypothetical protein
MAVLCAALVAARAGPACAQRDGPGNTNPSVTVPGGVRDLWREYPLDPAAPPASPGQPGSGEPSTQPRSSASTDADSESFPVEIAVAVGAAVLAVVALALLLTPRLVWSTDFRLAVGPGAQPFRRRPRRPERTSEDRLGDGAPSNREPMPAEPEDDELELDSADAAERSDAVKIARSATPEQGDQNESYAQVGEQVASVLAAAHQAAEALRAEADEYSREARAAADRYVATTRQQVEDEAAQRRAELDQEVREGHRAAEQRAQDIETEALQRRTAIIEEAKRSKARLAQLLGVYRGMTSQLEELLRAARAEDDAVEADDERAAGELANDLRPQRSRTEPASESGSPS